MHKLVKLKSNVPKSWRENATGTPEEIVKNRESHTARYLKEELDISR
jgi:hypothetical protein